MSAPGTIAVVSSELGRYTAFAQCLLAVDRPAATRVLWQAGGCNVAQNRNNLVEQSEGDWIWFLDDDHVFAPDTLSRLLARLDADDRLDAVVPFCVQRKPPCHHVLFSLPADGSRPVRLSLRPEARGLLQVDAAGAAGMLLRRRVFARLPAPWFEVGRWSSATLDEDLWWSKRMKDAGLRIACDLDTSIGHIAPMAVWPKRGQHGTVTLEWLLNGTENYRHAVPLELVGADA